MLKKNIPIESSLYNSILVYWEANSSKWETSRYSPLSYLNPFSYPIKLRLYLATNILLNMNSSMSWLELGCGSGLFFDKIKTHINEYQGVDISQQAIDQAVQKYKSTSAKFIRANLINFDSEFKFEGIVLLGVLDWLNLDDLINKKYFKNSDYIILSFTNFNESNFTKLYYRYLRRSPNSEIFPLKYSRNLINAKLQTINYSEIFHGRHGYGPGRISVFKKNEK